MADTVKLPGIGQVKTTYVYIGGALVAGIVGYAWWSRRGSSAAQAPTWDVDSVGETGYVSPGGGSSFTAPPPTGAYASNQEWANKALSWGLDHGFEFTLVAGAIALFLAKKPVSAKQGEFLQQALPQIGPPPSDGPHQIIPGSGPAPDPFTSDLPDLTRPGYEQLPDAPWRYTYALPGETYADIGKRVFPDWGDSPDRSGVIRAFREINTHITGPEPKAGDLVAYR